VHDCGRSKTSGRPRWRNPGLAHLGLGNDPSPPRARHRARWWNVA
jgi:hypothetical protein